MKAIKIANVSVSTFEDLSAVSNADLLGFYNATTGKSTSKFASRAKGLAQVWSLIEPQLAAEETNPHAASNKLIGEFLAREEAAAAPAPEVAPAPTLEEAPSAAPAAEKAPKERKQRGFRFKFVKRDEIKKVKEGSKRAKLLDLLKREGGATFEECMAETGWNRKDCYEGIRLLHYYVGYGLNQDESTGKIWVVY